jgi:hypothetical protein
MNLEDRIYFIPDFLEKNIADQIYEDVSSIPTHWFRRSIMPANESYEMKSWEETPELQNDIEFQNACVARVYKIEKKSSQTRAILVYGLKSQNL